MVRTEPLTTMILMLLAVAAAAPAAPLDRPERGPQNAGELLAQSSHVVTARVTRVAAREEPVDVAGVGNSDWIILCHLDVEAVLKGDGIEVGDSIVAEATATFSKNTAPDGDLGFANQ